MSVPVGPHGSLEVADGHCQLSCCWREEFECGCTIADFDLDRGIALGDVLHTTENLRHGGWSLLQLLLRAEVNDGVLDGWLAEANRKPSLQSGYVVCVSVCLSVLVEDCDLTCGGGARVARQAASDAG